MVAHKSLEVSSFIDVIPIQRLSKQRGASSEPISMPNHNSRPHSPCKIDDMLHVRLLSNQCWFPLKVEKEEHLPIFPAAFIGAHVVRGSKSFHDVVPPSDKSVCKST